MSLDQLWQIPPEALKILKNNGFAHPAFVGDLHERFFATCTSAGPAQAKKELWQEVKSVLPVRRSLVIQAWGTILTAALLYVLTWIPTLLAKQLIYHSESNAASTP